MGTARREVLKYRSMATVRARSTDNWQKKCSDAQNTAAWVPRSLEASQM
jgi:hypothetical protein